MEGTAPESRICVAVLTTGRQDWGILRSTCRWLASSSRFALRLLAGGMACDARFGQVDELIEADGFRIDERLPWLESETAPPHVEAARATTMIGDALQRQRPDALLLVGDRYETLAAALAATLLRIPIIHLHGGEETEGAFDNAIRHAVTKLSHLHLASHASYARRIIAMGEDPASVHVVGAPGLDNLRRTDLATKEELEAFLHARLDGPLVVVTVHPATLAAEAAADVEAVATAMSAVDATYVVTLPNSDPGNLVVRERFLALAKERPLLTTEALGERRYFGLLRIADAMLGNSSSGVIEAPALHLPVVNVGDRQKGRIRSAGILDVPAKGARVTEALRQALGPAFRAQAKKAPAPFGDGYAADAIGRVLGAWVPPRPPIKRFVERAEQLEGSQGT